MKTHQMLIILFICLVVSSSCGEESEKYEPVIQEGDIHGKITDSDVDKPIEGASVTIGDQNVITDKDGNYMVEGLKFSNELTVLVTASDYKEYKGTTALQQKLLVLNISLMPVDSPKTQVLGVLEGLSKDIEALDPAKIQSIQSRLSKDYAVGDDEATAFGVFAGVVPPSFDETPDTVKTIIDKYSKLKFTFAEPNVKLDESKAVVEMRFEVYAETKPNPPNPAKKWEIVINGKLILQKEDNDWKITFWQLIPPFLKFKEEPL